MIFSIDYPRKSEILKELKNLGHTEMDKSEEVAEQVRKAVKKQDIDDSSPKTEYLSSIYDSDELRNLEKSRHPEPGL